jgi:hypothetical protein
MARSGNRSEPNLKFCFSVVYITGSKSIKSLPANTAQGIDPRISTSLSIDQFHDKDVYYIKYSHMINDERYSMV